MDLIDTAKRAVRPNVIKCGDKNAGCCCRWMTTIVAPTLLSQLGGSLRTFGGGTGCIIRGCSRVVKHFECFSRARARMHGSVGVGLCISIYI